MADFPLRRRLPAVRRATVVGLLAVAGLILSTVLIEAHAMTRKCLFSEVHGVVLDHGQPVAGARLERTWFWHWNDERGGDTTNTDAAGAFRFPAVNGRSLSGSLLPHEPVIEQKILIQHGGKTYRAWVFSKGEYGENGELDGRPIRLTCRLESEPTRKQGVFGICELG